MMIRQETSRIIFIDKIENYIEKVFNFHFPRPDDGLRGVFYIQVVEGNEKFYLD